MGEEPRRGGLIPFVIFAIALTIYLFVTLVVNIEVSWGDELMWYDVGLQTVRGWLGGDPSWFLYMSEHPPLSKLLTGTFRLILLNLGLDRYPIPMRIQNSLFLSVMATVCYLLGQKLRSQTVGIMASSLFVLQSLVHISGSFTHNHIPGSLVQNDLLIGSLDITAAMFTCASAYFLIDYRGKRGLLVAGVFYGLATLSKYSSLFVLPALTFAWLIQRSSPRQTFLGLGVLVLAGMVTHLAGNPTFWNLQNLNFMLAGQSKYGVLFRDDSITYYPVLMGIAGQKLFSVELCRWLGDVLAMPLRLFVFYHLVKLMVVLILYAGYIQIKVKRSLFPLYWFTVTLFWIMTPNKQHIYYHIAFIAPLSLSCSCLLSETMLTSRLQSILTKALQGHHR